MKIAVCDDERMFVQLMERLLTDYAAYCDVDIQIQKFYSSSELLKADLSGCDVLLLDIDMPAPNGVAAAKQLREKYEDLPLMFVTGFIDYAPETFRVKAYRYILKKYLKTELPRCLDELREMLSTDGRLLTIHTRDRTLEVAAKEVLYFEGSSRREVLLHLRHEKEPISCKGRLKDYDAELSDNGFVRLHRSFLANLNHINWISNYMAELDDGTVLNVSQQNFAKAKKKFLTCGRQVR